MSLSFILSSYLSMDKHHSKRQVILQDVCFLFLQFFHVVQKPIFSVGHVAYQLERIVLLLTSSVAMGKITPIVC